MAQSLSRAIIGLTLLAASIGCGSESLIVTAEPSQEMEEFTMTHTRKGKRVWELRSPKARLKLTGGAEINKPEIRFFQNGNHTTTANADLAIVEDQTNDVHLEGNVVIVALKEKTKLTTDRLNYSTKDEMFRTEESVLIERPDARIRGVGLVADSALTDITIRSQETLLK